MEPRWFVGAVVAHHRFVSLWAYLPLVFFSLLTVVSVLVEVLHGGVFSAP